MIRAQDPVRVFFFGDSICFGQGVSIHYGWVPRISAHLESMGVKFDREIMVINASVNGNTTRQALERMPYDVLSHGVDVLIVQFGLNDCNYWKTDRGLPRVSLAAFAANIEEIVARAIPFGAERVILNTNHPTGRDQGQMPYTDITYEASNRRYNEVIRRVGRSLGDRVHLNDVETAFHDQVQGDRAQLEQLLLPDRLHLSKSGHDLYFNIVYPSVERAVARLLDGGQR